MTDFSHKALCDLAVVWLKRQNSARGHGCNVAVSECPSGYMGEIPDAIGFRTTFPAAESVLVEVKVTRSDFLADKRKPHRQAGGLGSFRYYMCPEGLIQVADLPPGWGLLWVNKRGHIKPMAGPVAELANCCNFQEVCERWRQPADQARELWLLAKLLSRVGDAEQMNRTIREAHYARDQALASADRLQVQLKERENARYRRRCECGITAAPVA